MRHLTRFLVVLLLGVLAITISSAAGPLPKTLVSKQKLQFIEFYSPMWTTCRQVVPIVHGLEKEYGSRIGFIQANILLPQSRPLMAKYNFNATPELYLVNAQGKVLGFWDDLTPREELKQAFDQALK